LKFEKNHTKQTKYTKHTKLTKLTKRTKHQKHKDRRQLRAQNRNVEDEMQLIKKIKKSCTPFLYYNKSTIPNLVVFESVVELVNGVLYDLIFVLDEPINITNMQIKNKMELAITILNKTILLLKDRQLITSLSIIKKYISDSNKQFTRRGSFKSFKTHDKKKNLKYIQYNTEYNRNKSTNKLLNTIHETKTINQIKSQHVRESLPQKLRNEIKSQRVRESLPQKLQTEIKSCKLLKPHSQPTKQDTEIEPVYTIKIAKANESTLPVTILTKKTKHDEKEDNDSWSCTIM